MDFRESLKATLNFEHPKEICQFEWGYWPETLDRWRKEGMPPGTEPWDAVGITRYHRVPVQVRLFPSFETTVLSEKGGIKTVRNHDGIVMEVPKDSTAFPRFLKHPVENLRDFEALMERLAPGSPGRFPANWKEEAAKLARRNSILVMGHIEISFFGWHRDLMGVENLLVAYYDQPELIHAISRQHLNFLKELYSKIARDVRFDFIFMWEDMSYKNGPLISPALIEEFMLPYYRELIGFFRELGDYKILLDSDGDVTKLIPLFTGVGVDGMLPFECAAGMDIVKIAEAYPKLIIAGGLDKREIAKGRKAIDWELECKLPSMFRRSGYLPSLDHHVPPEVSYDDFRYYLEKVRELHRENR